MTKTNHTGNPSSASPPATYALALIGVTLFSAAMLLPQPGIIAASAITSGCMAVVSYRYKLYSMSALFLFFSIFDGESLYAPIWRLWPLYLLVPLTLWFLILYLEQDYRTDGSSSSIAQWFKRGRLNNTTLTLGILTVVGSSTALGIWAHFHQPYLQSKSSLFPHFSGVLLVCAVCIFAVLNAILEETIFRGIVYGALTDSLKNRHVSIALQALAFGIAHFHGIPGGLSGVILACLYGLFLGWIRESSDGMMWPVLVHACADATIFAIVILSR